MHKGSDLAPASPENDGRQSRRGRRTGITPNAMKANSIKVKTILEGYTYTGMGPSPCTTPAIAGEDEGGAKRPGSGRSSEL